MGNNKDSEKLKHFIEDDFSFSDSQKVYWTKQEEDAVVEYLWLDETWLNNKIRWEYEEATKTSRDPDLDFIFTFENLSKDASRPENKLVKDKIFRDKLEKPLSKLVENIVFRYKLFRGDIDVKTLQIDSMSFILTKFANFKPSQNNKSYSYFGTIVKHYLIGEKKDNHKHQTSNCDYENHKEEVNALRSYELGDENHLDESSKLFKYVVDEMKRELEKTSLSDNDRNVGHAIINIFENHENFLSKDSYSKNILYQLIKEYTSLQTKDITYSLSRFKVLYKVIKQNFIRDSK